MHTPEDMSQRDRMLCTSARLRPEAERPLCTPSSPDSDLVGPSLEAILGGLISAERGYPQRARHGVGKVGRAAHDEACVLYGRQCLRTQTAVSEIAHNRSPQSSVYTPQNFSRTCAHSLMFPDIRDLDPKSH